jgi:hypothetical protein
VGVDPAEAGLMRRAPRDPRAGVITPRMWWGIGAGAVVIGAGTLLVLDAGLPGGLDRGQRLGRIRAIPRLGVPWANPHDILAPGRPGAPCRLNDCYRMPII